MTKSFIPNLIAKISNSTTIRCSMIKIIFLLIFNIRQFWNNHVCKGAFENIPPQNKVKSTQYTNEPLIVFGRTFLISWTIKKLVFCDNFKAKQMAKIVFFF